MKVGSIYTFYSYLFYYFIIFLNLIIQQHYLLLLLSSFKEFKLWVVNILLRIDILKQLIDI